MSNLREISIKLLEDLGYKNLKEYCYETSSGNGKFWYCADFENESCEVNIDLEIDVVDIDDIDEIVEKLQGTKEVVNYNIYERGNRLDEWCFACSNTVDIDEF